MGESTKLTRRGKTELSLEQAERVLRRAIELQQSEAGRQTVSLTEIEEMAAELGVSAETVQAAYRDERQRALVPVQPARGALDRMIGAARVTITRLFERSAAETRERLSQYLSGQLFRVRRNDGDTVIWEPAEDLSRKVKRALDFSGRYELPTSLHLEVTVTASPNAPEGECEVVIVIDFSEARNSIALASGLGATAIAGGGVAIGLLFTPWIMPFAGALALGSIAFSRMAYRSDVRKAIDALDRALG